MGRWQVLKNGIPVKVCETSDEAEDTYARFDCDEVRELWPEDLEEPVPGQYGICPVYNQPGVNCENCCYNLSAPGHKVKCWLRQRHGSNCPTRSDRHLGKVTVSLSEVRVNPDDFPVASLQPLHEDVELLQTALADVFSDLTPRERLVLKLRYGLFGTHQQTLQTIGTFIGLTRERIRQIEMKALRRIRRSDRLKKLEAARGNVYHEAFVSFHEKCCEISQNRKRKRKPTQKGGCHVCG